MTLRLNEISASELSVTNGEKPVLTYRYGHDLYKPYFHPIHAPNGLIVTGDRPEGHVHHRGLCFASEKLNGINYWTETNCNESVRGRVVHREFCEKIVNLDAVHFAVINDWRAPDNSNPIEETCYVTVHQPQLNQQIIDFQFSLEAQSSDVSLAPPCETQGLCCRMAEMEYRKVTNSDGCIGESEVSGKVAKWCSLNGVLSNEVAGVAIFNHPSNLRHPASFMVLDDAFGFMSAVFTGDEPHLISAGETLTLNYRLIVYLGDIFTFDLWTCYEEYVKH